MKRFAMLLLVCGWTSMTFAATPSTRPAAAAAPKANESMETMAGESMTGGSMADQSMSGSMMATAADSTGSAAKVLTKQQTEFFETKIRPILAKNCYECHSLAEHKSKGGLLLDTRDGWQKGGKHGPAIVPGDVAKSLLLKAVNQVDPDFAMPPEGAKLKDIEIAALTEWIKMGAPDPRVGTVSKLTGLNDKARAHWSYQAVKNPAVPAVTNTSWVKTPIDAFVLAKLDANKMKPSPAASRETLIRRATYDLVGLPPTPEEVADFVSDPSTDAFGKVVDRLLASPHYGERWGRYWLDTARYSDTAGTDDKRIEYRFPFAWAYRDYVINSFNADKPYDLFLKEQIAADLLPTAKTDQSTLAGLGFITVGKRFQNPNDTIDERIDAVCKGTMAMTVACARCHDHKFDPVPTADYYSLHGVFASINEPLTRPLVAKESTDDPSYIDFSNKLAALEQRDKDLYYDLIKEKSAEFRKKAAAYLMVEALGKRGGADSILLRDSMIAKNDLQRDVYGTGNRDFRTQQSNFGPLRGFASIPKDNFDEEAQRLLAKIVRGDRPWQRVNPIVVKAFAAIPPDSLHSLQDVADVYGKLYASIDAQAKQYIEDASHATTTNELKGYDSDLVDLISVPANIELAPALTTAHLQEIAPKLPVVNQQGYYHLCLGEINDLLLTHPGSPPRAMVVEDADHPHNSAILIRGDASNRGAVVPRQFLSILAGPNRQPFKIGSGRLELAEAIADKKNPLTARVMVNRIWMHHFGAGFVRTPDDLGVQSEDPSHPELLDYLASRFMQDGWSIKQMHRLIMLSSVYQESSENNAEYALKDSENRLLWRANLRRLDFEAVRDSMLVFTGELDQTIGGKPVNLTDEPYSDRRSVYGFIDRGKVPELMSQFDFADPDMVNSRRTTTIVPQQALFYMNSPMTINVARKITKSPEFGQAITVAQRVKEIYTVLFQRAPQPREIALAQDFLKSAGLKDADTTQPSKANPALAKQHERDAQREAKIEEAFAERQKKQAEAMNNQRRDSRRTFRNTDGDFVMRRPLTPWEQYTQALLFTNEIAYVN